MKAPNYTTHEDKIIQEGHARELQWKVIAENIRIVTGRVRSWQAVRRRALHLGLGPKWKKAEGSARAVEIYMRSEQYEKLKKLARARGDSLSGYMKYLIEEKYDELQG